MNVSMHSCALLGLVGLASLAACSGNNVGSAPEATIDESTRIQGLTGQNALPTLPSPTLAVPDGNRLAFHLDAVGVQIYTCSASGTWAFVAPKANLYDRGGEVVATHYRGRTWDWLEDGSTVVGAKLAAFTPDPSAIPWLLLGALSHGGEGRMTKVSYIQRLDTVGGNAPSGACGVVGATADVPYSATYYFYVPSNGSDDPGGHGNGNVQDDSP